MNLQQALANVPNKKKHYFLWKHDIRYDQTLPKKTEKEFLNFVGQKSLNGFISWERTAEYKQLLMLLLDSKVANDFDEIYKVVTDKAKQGDEKSIRLFLAMQKEVSANAKMVKKSLETVREEEEIEVEDDGLEI